MTTQDFIAIYDNAMTSEFCKGLIKKFERDRSKKPGVTGHGINITAKDSQDINISMDHNWDKEHRQIADLTWQYLVRYIREYPHLLSGALTLSFPDPQTGQPIQITEEIIQMLDDKTLGDLIRTVYRLGTINLQKYDRKRGGYHHYHSENYPSMNDPDQLGLHRVLLFMYYLNDVREGGHTEFLYQNRMLQPTKGQLVFAPSGFTHTHKGHIPTSNDKYILTSWILFQPASVLYANQAG